MNVFLLLAFGPYYTVHKKNCLDKRFRKFKIVKNNGQTLAGPKSLVGGYNSLQYLGVRSGDQQCNPLIYNYLNDNHST